MTNRNKDKKVFVGMSGGVDSSVSAALLKNTGPNNFEKLFGRPAPRGFSRYDVTGVFIKVWEPDFTPCNWREERRDAMRAAAHLGIPFKTFDFEKEYKKEVVDYMIEEYRKGRTPNPDIMCNRHIKFGSFLRKALQEGADYVATGHYSRISPRDEVRKASSYELLAGIDPNKDQSYFLWTLKEEDLAHAIFPVGGMTKEEVRQKAREFGLPNAEKKDSQGICFIGKIDVKDFLSEYIEPQKGDVLNIGGEVIGEHDGAYFYTLGQRHGFRVTRQTSEQKPLYVVEKSIEENTITVSEDVNLKELPSTRREVEIESVNWISGKAPEGKVKARLRYRQNLRGSRVDEKSGKTTVVFDELQENVTPGQSLVFYDGEICLGGGVIT